MLQCLQIFCFRTNLRIREVRSPYSCSSNTVLPLTALKKYLTVFGKDWNTSRDESPSISVYDLDRTHDIHTYNPGLPMKRMIQTSDDEEEDP